MPKRLGKQAGRRGVRRRTAFVATNGSAPRTEERKLMWTVGRSAAAFSHRKLPPRCQRDREGAARRAVAVAMIPEQSIHPSIPPIQKRSMLPDRSLGRTMEKRDDDYPPSRPTSDPRPPAYSAAPTRPHRVPGSLGSSSRLFIALADGGRSFLVISYALKGFRSVVD